MKDISSDRTLEREDTVSVKEDNKIAKERHTNLRHGKTVWRHNEDILSDGTLERQDTDLVKRRQ